MKQLSIEEAIPLTAQRFLWEYEALSINELAGKIIEILEESKERTLVLRIDTAWQKAIER